MTHCRAIKQLARSRSRRRRLAADTGTVRRFRVVHLVLGPTPIPAAITRLVQHACAHITAACARTRSRRCRDRPAVCQHRLARHGRPHGYSGNDTAGILAARCGRVRHEGMLGRFLSFQRLVRRLPRRSANDRVVASDCIRAAHILRLRLGRGRVGCARRRTKPELPSSLGKRECLSWWWPLGRRSRISRLA